MTAFELLQAMGTVDDSMITELMSAVYHTKTKNYVNHRPAFRLLITAALAVSIIAALGLAAYAISSIHQRRQEELRAQYKVEQNNVTSYVEYPEQSIKSGGVTLISAINDGKFQTVFVNVSPISYEEAYAGAYHQDFWCSVDGGETGHNVDIPWDSSKLTPEDYYTVVDEDTGEEFQSVLPESCAKNMMEKSYDTENQTLTLCCTVPNSTMTGRNELELSIIRSVVKDKDNRIEVEPGVYGYETELKFYGSVTFKPTEEYSRLIMLPEPVPFGELRFVERGSIAGIELQPTCMKMFFDIEDAEGLFAPGGDTEKRQALKDWSNMMDDAVRNTRLHFADGTVVSSGGILSSPVENGYVCAYSGAWGSTVDINALVAIEIYDSCFEIDTASGSVKRAAKSPGISLLSALSDEKFQYGYVNVWPVTEEEAVAGMDGFTFFFSVSQPGCEESIRTAGIEYDPAELQPGDYEMQQLSGMDEAIELPSAKALERLRMKKSYDAQSQTLTLHFSIIKKQWDISKPVELTFFTFDQNQRRDKVYGSLSLDFTQPQSREIMFAEPLAFENPELRQQGCITGMKLYPCSADVYFDIPDAYELFGKDDVTAEEYRRAVSWLNPMIQAEWSIKLIFSDGTQFSLPSGNGTVYDDGCVCSYNSWNTTININSIERIEFSGETVEFDYVN